MNDPVDRDFCDSAHKRTDEKIDRIFYVLEGNGDIRKGLRYQVQTMWEDYLTRKRTTMGWVDWIYRSAIGILLVYIAAKLGLIVN